MLVFFIKMSPEKPPFLCPNVKKSTKRPYLAMYAPKSATFSPMRMYASLQTNVGESFPSKSLIALSVIIVASIAMVTFYDKPQAPYRHSSGLLPGGEITQKTFCYVTTV